VSYVSLSMPTWVYGSKLVARGSKLKVRGSRLVAFSATVNGDLVP
jgi:hypothetical protein